MLLASSLEVRIPIGDEKSMWTRAAYITRAVRMQVPDAHVRVTVGAASNPPEGSTKMWRELGQDMEVHRIPRHEFMRWHDTNNKNTATILERFKPPFNSENVILIDADCFPIGNIMEPFKDNQLELAAMIAHAAPFADSKQWDRLSAGFLRDRNKIIVHAHYSYTGKGIMAQADSPAPPYFNTGVVYAKATTLNEISPALEEAAEFTRNCMNSYFVDQIALTLALLKKDIQPTIMSPMWNFPNDPGFQKVYPNDLDDVRWIHFLRDNQVQREHDFHDHLSIRNFILRSDLNGSNEILRKAVAKTYREINLEKDT